MSRATGGAGRGAARSRTPPSPAFSAIRRKPCCNSPVFCRLGPAHCPGGLQQRLRRRQSGDHAGAVPEAHGADERGQARGGGEVCAVRRSPGHRRQSDGPALEPLGDKKLDRGVNARLVFTLRREIDRAYENWTVPFAWLERAKAYCRNVKITVTGGFTPAQDPRVRGKRRSGGCLRGRLVFVSAIPSRTARTTTSRRTSCASKSAASWRDLAKVGRRAAENPALLPVDWDAI